MGKVLAGLCFRCASLTTSKYEKIAYFFTKHHVLLQIPVLYHIAESTVFPRNLYLYKAYIVRKVFNQPNIQGSLQEQVVQPNQADMHTYAYVCMQEK